jgi:hypothetical protein
MAGPIERKRVLMYSRKICGLCDKARGVILRERERSRFDFEEVFIDDDQDLESHYGLRVPVVEVNGVERFEFEVEPHRLHQLVVPG